MQEIIEYISKNGDNYLLAFIILYIYERFFKRVFNGTIKNLTKSIEINTNTIMQLKNTIEDLKNFLYYKQNKNE